MLKCLVLAGGFATRLRPLSCSKPKLLFPIVGVPLIESTATWLASGGVDEIILAVNHFSDRLKVAVGDQVGGVRVLFSVEETPLGTGGPIRHASHLLGSQDTFLAMNGDIVSDIDIRSLIASHEKSHADATIALVSARDASAYGSVVADSTGMVRQFEEKARSSSDTGMVNAGVYALSPTIIDAIPIGRPLSLEMEVFPKLLKEGRIHSWRHDGLWYDIGRISEYIRANKELLVRDDLTYDQRDANRIIRPAYIGTGARLESKAMVGPHTILCSNVKVANGSRVRESIVFEDTEIGEKTLVENSIVGEHVVIGNDSRIGSGSIIAGHVSIPPRTLVSPNSVLLF